uniref:Uncharacterized protein n=1 Tax=Opuntia streptacantha TaxID=393608 RepID=A0A7C9DRP6_OPUST
MPSRKRKKPPDLPLLSLLPSLCRLHAPTPVLLSFSFRSPSLSAGVRSGLTHTLEIFFIVACCQLEADGSAKSGATGACPYPNSRLGEGSCRIATPICSWISEEAGKAKLNFGLSFGSVEAVFPSPGCLWTISA